MTSDDGDSSSRLSAALDDLFERRGAPPEVSTTQDDTDPTGLEVPRAPSTTTPASTSEAHLPSTAASETGKVSAVSSAGSANAVGSVSPASSVSPVGEARPDSPGDTASPGSSGVPFADASSAGSVSPSQEASTVSSGRSGISFADASSAGSASSAREASPVSPVSPGSSGIPAGDASPVRSVSSSADAGSGRPVGPVQEAPPVNPASPGTSVRPSGDTSPADETSPAGSANLALDEAALGASPYVLPAIVPATEPTAEPQVSPVTDALPLVPRAATSAPAPAVVVSQGWGDHMPVVNVPGAGELRAAGRRPRVRRVTRVIRHVDPWSVFKVGLIFSLVTYAVLLTSGVLLWRVAESTGSIDNVERWFTQFGWETFEFKGGELFRNAWTIGLFGVVAMTGGLVLLATLFNLVSDIVGGVRVTVLEEEVVERTASNARRYVVRRPVEATNVGAAPSDWSVDDDLAATSGAPTVVTQPASVTTADWSVDD